MLVFGGAFAVIALIGVLALDPAFFYPRLSNDPLLYYLKGVSFAETGRSEARVAINVEPLRYVSMPGILRAPLFLAFDGFDARLRAIQIANIALVAVTATMFAYILSWAMSKRWHWLAIAFTFGFVLLSPVWIANILAPLGDAPYALFTLAAITVAARVLASDSSLRSRWLLITFGTACFLVAFLVRFTAPFVLAFAGALAIGRGISHRLPTRRLVAAGLVATAFVIVVVVLNWDVISQRYLGDFGAFRRKGDRPSMILNLVGLAIPSQVVPVFHLGFARPPMLNAFHPVFGTTLRDVAWTAIGIAMSCVVLLGMWRTRKEFLPESLYLLAALPVLMLIIPSTSRYLMAYQPITWIFFFAGSAFLLGPVISRWGKSHAAPIAMLVLAAAAAAGMAVIRTQNMAGTVLQRKYAISIVEVPEYTAEVSSTFRALREFLESLPRDRALLVGAHATVGRWKAISGMDYYYPDSALAQAVTRRDVYLLAECGTRHYCLYESKWELRPQQRLATFGRFSYERVFYRAGKHARVAVFRVHPGP